VLLFALVVLGRGGSPAGAARALSGSAATPEGRLVSLVKADLREWSVSPISPMPSYKETLSAEALADLLAYLVSLTDGAL